MSSLEIDAAVSVPGEVNLEELEQLEQLEPYGAGNPRPVFALLGAMVDSVQPVGQGKHLKLRLSKGMHRFDAIFFSVSEEACGISAGNRVDVAFYLQANSFRGNTTLQLQLIDIRHSLLPSRHEAEALALLRRLKAGDPLSPQETSRLNATREQFASYWVVLERWLRCGKAEEPMLPLVRRLAGAGTGAEGFLRAALSLEVFEERRLLSLCRCGDHLTLSLNPMQGKVDLFACPYLARLQEPATNRN